MKIEEIKMIVKLMSDNDLTEFKIEAEEYNLCIRRGDNKTQIVSSAPSAPTIVQHAEPAPAVAAPAATPAEEIITIDSPIVGTFYRAPSPDAEPFVKIGDRVDSDNVVCIIEAMKVMNEVKAEKSGVIKEILAENTSPVEYGQPLFVIQ